MRCIYCGDSMVVVDRYNPPYPEPKETVYYCEHCKIKASDNEAYGVEFDELDDDDDDNDDDDTTIEDLEDDWLGDDDYI